MFAGLMSMSNCILMLVMSMFPAQMLSLSLFTSILLLISMLTVHLVLPKTRIVLDAPNRSSQDKKGPET